MIPKFLMLIALSASTFAMEPAVQNRRDEQKDFITKLLAPEFQLDDQDILDLEQYLQKEGAAISTKEQSRGLFDDLLFKISQCAWGTSAARVGQLLIEAGADPHAQYAIYEILIIGSDKQYHHTAYSIKTDAKTEAKGSLKKYLDSLASDKN